jgi:hypothetical protein
MVSMARSKQMHKALVIPAKAGIQFFGAYARVKSWIPAFAGMTMPTALRPRPAVA